MPTGPDKDRLLPNERTSAAALLACLTLAALLVCFTILGCAPPYGEAIGVVEPEPPPEVDPGALGGENLGGSNLGGVNLGGANLGGSNGAATYKNCATFASCAPGAVRCPWGVVWSDAGACR